MSATATDAHIEGLERLVETEEAGILKARVGLEFGQCPLVPFVGHNLGDRRYMDTNCRLIPTMGHAAVWRQPKSLNDLAE